MNREARISNYVLAVFTAVCVLLLSLPLSEPVRAAKAGLGYILYPIAYYGSKGTDRLADVPIRVRSLINADIDNTLMRSEVKRAVWVRAEAESLALENQRLRRALGLKAPRGRSGFWTRVMERDPLHWYRSVVIDAGSEQGVALNAAVLGPAGEHLVAVGRVVEVRPESSTVLLLTDELAAVAAYLSSAAVEGLITGEGSSRLKMNYLGADVALSTGDIVLTSPTSVTFPPDLPIGLVSRVYPRDPFLTFQSVEIAPTIDASLLKEVMVLNKNSASEDLPQSDVP